MKFFSGFSLANEQAFFYNYIKENAYTVVGFSYGSIKALEEVLGLLEKHKRVDTLQLLSPVFFQTKEERFRSLQLLSYKKNRSLYMKQFIRGCFAPFAIQSVEHIETNSEELKELLYYIWNKKDFILLKEKGVKVEIYLGGKDKIIDVQNAREFFRDVGTLTYVKNANHFLQVS